MDEPELPRPDGYVQDYFEGDKRIYCRKGTDPDRIYTSPINNGGGLPFRIKPSTVLVE